MKNACKYIFGLVAALVTIGLVVCWATESPAQQTASAEQLQPMEVEPPATPPQRVESSSSQAPEGFGYGEPTPSGIPYSDYVPSPGEVTSVYRRPTNLATTNSAVSIMENRGVGSLGNSGLTEMVQSQPGVLVSNFGGNQFQSQVIMRGFSNTPANYVSLVFNGTNLNVPRQEATPNIFFPELIERVEVLRGDGTVQFGNKAIGGTISVITKKPRQHPGVMAGAELGSWGMDREWSSLNYVRDSLALGLFVGRYSEEGWRIHYDTLNFEESSEPVTRTGPWTLTNVYGSINWKITPRITIDLTHLLADQRLGSSNQIQQDRWDRRDTRDISDGPYGDYSYHNFPQERWDNMTIAKLFYNGLRLGDLELVFSRRSYDRSVRNLFDNPYEATDVSWRDLGFQIKYKRTDGYGPVRNEFTAGTDILDGRLIREIRNIDPTPSPGNWSGTEPGGLQHKGRQSFNRESLSYYLLNQTVLYDRLVLGLGHRIESYDIRNIYSENTVSGALIKQQSYEHLKSASQWSLGFIYDTELGSNVYFKHSRMYRFANPDDFINLGFQPGGGSHPDPIWLLDPEEGTLQEIGLRHWFTRNIYLSLTYYQLWMDNQIFFVSDPNAPSPWFPGWYYSRNTNVPDVDNYGIELETMIRLTPRWTFRGNYTQQNVFYRSNLSPTDSLGRSTEDKWPHIIPREIGHASLAYDNKDWGFSAMIALHYVGSRWREGDMFNERDELEPAKWGDLSFSQTFFDDTLTIYFGVKNFSDHQYSIYGSTYGLGAGPLNLPYLYDPEAGRTYYAGIKSNMDFHRMRMPTSADIRRMGRRLYGMADQGRAGINGMFGRLRNTMPF